MGVYRMLGWDHPASQNAPVFLSYYLIFLAPAARKKNTTWEHGALLRVRGCAPLVALAEETLTDVLAPAYFDKHRPGSTTVTCVTKCVESILPFLTPADIC